MRYKFVIVFSAIMVTISALRANVEAPQSQIQPEWWESAVFYQIYPRSFKDSKGNGTGDIKGITESLNYLKELGVDAVWLSPIFESPMIDFGYDISNFTKVDPLFGTMQDFENLLQTATEINIKIILDFVPNHSSDKCEWFKKSIKREDGFDEFYVWHDGIENVTDPDARPSVPNNWQSHFYGSSWTWNDERKQYYYHQFAVEQPDFNYRNRKVLEEMRNVMNFWMAKGVAGFRVDAANFLYEDEMLRDEPLTNQTDDPHSYDYTEHILIRNIPETFNTIHAFREIVDAFHKKHGGDAPILMTEAYVNKTEYIKYYGVNDGKMKGSQIPFNFVLLNDVDEKSTASDFKRVIDGRISIVKNLTGLNWVTGNHDRPRVGSRFGAGKIDALLTLVLTLPGIAVTYQGEEIGMVDNSGILFNETVDPQGVNVGANGPWKELSRDPIRTPFQWNNKKFAGFMPANATAKPWLPIHPNYIDVNVEDELNATRSTLKYYKRLVQLRKNPAFKHRSYTSKVLSDRALGYVREHIEANETFVVLINFAGIECQVNVTELTTKLNKMSEVVLAGAKSNFVEGQVLNNENILLREYDTVILKAFTQQ